MDGVQPNKFEYDDPSVKNLLKEWKYEIMEHQYKQQDQTDKPKGRNNRHHTNEMPDTIQFFILSGQEKTLKSKKVSPLIFTQGQGVGLHNL